VEDSVPQTSNHAVYLQGRKVQGQGQAQKAQAKAIGFNFMAKATNFGKAKPRLRAARLMPNITAILPQTFTPESW